MGDTYISTYLVKEMYILIFTTINLFVYFIIYIKIHNLLLSSFLSSIISIIIIYFLEYLFVGYLDPFIVFGFFLGWIYCFIFSILIGLVIYLTRLKIKNK